MDCFNVFFVFKVSVCMELFILGELVILCIYFDKYVLNFLFGGIVEEYMYNSFYVFSRFVLLKYKNYILVLIYVCCCCIFVNYDFCNIYCYESYDLICFEILKIF